MPKCKICGEAVQSGEVMHVECRESWQEEMRERERALDMREFELDVRDGSLETWYEEIISTEKNAKRLLVINIAVAAFNVVIAILNFMM